MVTVSVIKEFSKTHALNIKVMNLVAPACLRSYPNTREVESELANFHQMIVTNMKLYISK